MTHTASGSKLRNVLTVLIGAMLMGMLWRVRGTHGWGSSWGLLNAGIVFVLFLTVAVGERKKMNFAWTSLTALSFMLTVPAWGTLLNQITGVLATAENVADGFVYISPASGVFMMFCLGFGMATIFGIMLGRGYSDKQWKITDIIILLAVFYIFDLVAKATLSHYIIGLVQPQAAEAFAADLKLAGIEGSVHKVYLEHFANDAWAKKFTVEALGRISVAGRNYFAEVQAIASAFSSIFTLIATRYVIGDKRAAATGAVTCGAFSIAITASDLFFWFENGGYRMLGDYNLPDSYAAWSLWEYFTGFIAGGIITAFMLCLKKKDDVCEPTFAFIPQKVQTVFTFILGFIVMIGVSLVRPVLERFDESEYMLVFVILSILIAVAIAAVLSKKYGCALERVSYTKFSGGALPCFVTYIFAAYMFIGCEEYLCYKEIGMIHNILVTVSFVCVLLWSAVEIKRMKTK